MIISDDMELLPLEEGELDIGQPLPWDVYSGPDAKIIMRQGAILDSEQKKSQLMEVGLRYKMKPAADTSDDQPSHDKSNAKLPQPERYPPGTNPFAELNVLFEELDQLFTSIEEEKAPVKSLQSRVYLLASQLQGLCLFDADALLGAVHLARYPYIIQHPVHVAIICELIARRLQLEQATRLSVLAAALTANVSMNPYQLRLNSQQKGLSPEQRKLVNEHPQRSMEILRQAQVEDAFWLELVLQHHERINGSGYPAGLQGEAIRQEARIIGLADIYSALVSPRPYRSGVSAHKRLRALFLERGEQFDEQLTLLFLSELGLFPPGSCVRLSNGEKAVVIKRCENIRNPIVASWQDRNGGIFLQPLHRDTSETPYAIKAILNSQHIPKMDPAMLWGLKLLRMG